MKDEDNYIILDVRTQSEYDDGHIPNAVCVPNETIGGDDIPELPDRTAYTRILPQRQKK